MVAAVIGMLLLLCIALLFYVGRMLFLAAGTPGGNFDAPGDPSDLTALADAASSSESSHSAGISSHGHDSGGFDGGTGSHH